MPGDPSPRRHDHNPPADADTDGDIGDIETPLSPEAIRAMLADGRQPTPRQLTSAFLSVVVERLGAVVLHMNRSFGPSAAVLRTPRSTPALVATLSAGIILRHPTERFTLLDFYTRGAAAIRAWVLAELARNPARDPGTRRRIGAWAEYHRAAGALPPGLREVHDLLWYFGWADETAAAVLGLAPDDFHERRLDVKGFVEPLRESAYGRTS